jgi:hypothetical protein
MQGKTLSLFFWEVEMEVWEKNEGEKEGREGLCPFISMLDGL